MTNVQPPLLDTTPVETYAHGVTRQWAYDGKIAIFRLTDFSRKSIDAWIDAVKETALTSNGGSAYFLHDFTSTPGTIVLPPYARQRAEELTTAFPTLTTVVAILLPRSFVTPLMNMFMSVQKRQKGRFRVFGSRDEALAWLKSQVDRA
jgi:hypothetical protein